MVRLYLSISFLIIFISIIASASMYQEHPVPNGWNVTFHNESLIEMTDGNSTMAMYNFTIPKMITDWLGTDDFLQGPDLSQVLRKKFIEISGLKFDPAPACKSLSTNQGLHPFGAERISVTYCDCGDYLFAWKTPGMDNNYTFLYAKFRGDYNTTLAPVSYNATLARVSTPEYPKSSVDNKPLPTTLYEFLS